MEDKKMRKLEDLFDDVRKLLATAQKEIYLELEKSINKNVVEILKGNNKYGSQGKNIKNDYRNYFWIDVRIGENTYTIGLVHADVSPVNGNPHAQFGRIQFWKGVRYWGNDEVGSPHQKDSTGKYWCFCSENSDDQLEKLTIDDDDYAVKTVAAFLDFLEREGEQNVKKP
jgi:hypothetical protein